MFRLGGALLKRTRHRRIRKLPKRPTAIEDVVFRYYPLPEYVVGDELLGQTIRASKARPFSYNTDPVELQLPVYDFRTAANTGKVSLDAYLFACPPRADVIHAAVVCHNASLRAGNHFSKGREDVAKSRRKLRPQKGSGRARMGSGRSPLLVGGGHAHPKRPKDYGYSLPAGTAALAMRSALTTKLYQKGLQVVSDFEIPAEWEPEQFMQHCFDTLKWPLGKANVLIVHGNATEFPESAVDPNLDRVTLPLEFCDTIAWNHLGVYHILRYRLVVLTESALQKLSESMEDYKYAAAPLHYQQRNALAIPQQLALPLQVPSELLPEKWLMGDDPLIPATEATKHLS